MVTKDKHDQQYEKGTCSKMEISLFVDQKNSYFMLIIAKDKKYIIDTDTANEEIAEILNTVSREYKIRKDDLEALIAAGNRLCREKYL